MNQREEEIRQARENIRRAEDNFAIEDRIAMIICVAVAIMTIIMAAIGWLPGGVMG